MKKKVYREKYYGKNELAQQVEEMLEITPIQEPKKKGRKKKND